MLEVCLDESGHESKEFVVVAGFYGAPEQWASFAHSWRAAVGSEFFHMKDLRWKKSATQLRLARLGRVPYQHGLQAVVGGVKVSDYDHLPINDIERRATCGYILALYPVVLSLLQLDPVQISFKFERQDRYEPRVRDAFRVIGKTLNLDRKLQDITFLTRANEPCTQVADYLAYAQLQQLRDPSSTRAEWTKPIFGAGRYLGTTLDADLIRKVVGFALPAARLKTALERALRQQATHPATTATGQTQRGN